MTRIDAVPGGRLFAVDTVALESASGALATVARLAFDARGLAGRATDGAGWAVDDPLPLALDRLATVLDGALGRLGDDARQAAALLAVAGARYAAAEAAATAPPPALGPPGSAR